MTTLISGSDSRINSTFTNASQSVVNGIFKIECDKSLTCTTTGTTFTLSGDPSFVLAIGDIIFDSAQNEWRRVATISGTGPTAGTVDAAFSVDLSTDAVMCSQAVWTKDLVNDGDAAEKTRFRDLFPTTSINTISIDYSDSLAADDNVHDLVDEARVVVSASNEGLQTDTSTVPTGDEFSGIFTRATGVAQIDDYPLSVNANDERMFLVFFCNPANASVTAQANVIKYELNLYADDATLSGGTLNSAFGMSDGSGTPINATITVESGKTRVIFPWSYVTGLNAGESVGALRVKVDGQDIPRFVSGSTVDAYYTEYVGGDGVPDGIEFHTDLSGAPVSIEVWRHVGVVDSADENVNNIAINATNIATNVTDIATNAADIAANALDTITFKSSTYTAVTTDEVIQVSSGSAFTVTLYPAAGNAGKKLTILKTSSDFNPVTIEGNASETINGNLNTNVVTQYERIELLCNGFNWFIMRRDCNTAWISFTPTFGNVTLNSGNTNGRWRRIGDSIEIQAHIYMAGDTTVDSSITIQPPTGIAFDGSKVAVTGQYQTFGTAMAYDSAIDRVQGNVCYNSATSMVFNSNTGSASAWASTTPFTWTTNDRLTCFFSAPITDWKAENE
jgi:hypothetical protein